MESQWGKVPPGHKTGRALSECAFELIIPSTNTPMTPLVGRRLPTRNIAELLVEIHVEGAATFAAELVGSEAAVLVSDARGLFDIFSTYVVDAWSRDETELFLTLDAPGPTARRMDPFEYSVRCSLRARVELQAYKGAQLESDRYVPVTVERLSHVGLRFESALLFPAGVVMRLSIELPDGNCVAGRCTVGDSRRQSSGRCRFDAEWGPLSAPSRDFLNRFILEQYLKRGGW